MQTEMFCNRAYATLQEGKKIVRRHSLTLERD